MSDTGIPGTAAAATATAAPSKETKGGFRLGLWEGLALLLGLAGDIAAPIGNYSLWLMIGAAALTGLLFLLRRFAHARTAMLHSGFATALMAVIWLTQTFATPQGSNLQERGALVSFAPVLAPFQTTILPLSDDRKALMAFQDAIASGSDNERVAEARDQYANTQDRAVQRGMIEAMMGSGNAALQQTATLIRFQERERDGLVLAPISRDATDALSRRLLSYNFRVREADIDSGGLRLLGDGFESSGTVSRQGTVLQLYIDMPDSPRQLMTVDLAPGADLRLTGTARLDNGAKAAVELPLF
ncbi:MAG: hypothetical protein C0520_07265 [Sphingopyxis sp.]|nr:hypothetical protein [Sphingopyxis sp.]